MGAKDIGIVLLLLIISLFATVHLETRARLDAVESELSEMKAAAAAQGYVFMKPSAWSWHPVQK